MDVVILCGGYGTRLSEETHLRPKPMVEIGGKTNFMAYHEDFSIVIKFQIFTLP